MYLKQEVNGVILEIIKYTESDYIELTDISITLIEGKLPVEEFKREFMMVDATEDEFDAMYKKIQNEINNNR